MKFLLLLSLVSLSAFSQDDSRCALELSTHDREDLGMIGLNKNKAFMKVLERKGYDVVLKKDDDWDKISDSTKDEELFERLNNRIYLYGMNFQCMNSNSNVSINIGSFSWSNPKDKWRCPPGVNLLDFKAISHGELYSPEKNILSYARKNMDLSKTFKTREEAEDQLIKAYDAIIPSCEELRQRYPEVGRPEEVKVEEEKEKV